MPLNIHPATASDALRACQIEAAAYAPSPFNKILFPGPFPPNALEQRAETMAAQLRQDPTARWLKVVDTDVPDDEPVMVAFAKWHVRPAAEALTPREFGEGCNDLHLLHTDPKYQRRGAGSMLIQWGLDEARRLGVIAYLESSKEGHSLYLRKGFKDVDMHVVDMRKWGAEKEHVSWAMIWDPLEN